MRNNKIKTTFPPHPWEGPGSVSLLTLLLPPPRQHTGMGNLLHLCCSFLLTLFLCSSVEALPQDTVLCELLQRGSFPAAAVSHKITILAWVPHGITRPARKTYSCMGFPPWAAVPVISLLLTVSVYPILDLLLCDV